jgi:hypothetical protein
MYGVNFLLVVKYDYGLCLALWRRSLRVAYLKFIFLLCNVWCICLPEADKHDKNGYNNNNNNHNDNDNNDDDNGDHNNNKEAEKGLKYKGITIEIRRM